ncbi:MAG TPA: type II toxin-antitoxin system VapC family toxin [Thermodesulfobacteriota bacterium]|nr:type II toxin-antitoxin system VapC family toxin [Thermodesulfobacteriota bacterium]
MSNPSDRICIDASLALKWVLPEKHTDWALELLYDWISKGFKLIAPTLFIFEVTSTLRNKVHRQIISWEEGFLALDQIRRGRIELILSPKLVDRAWEISGGLRLPTAYDAFYLALAEEQNCQFWTADRNLVSILKKHKMDWARWIGD